MYAQHIRSVSVIETSEYYESEDLYWKYGGCSNPFVSDIHNPIWSDEQSEHQNTTTLL